MVVFLGMWSCDELGQRPGLDPAHLPDEGLDWWTMKRITQQSFEEW